MTSELDFRIGSLCRRTSDRSLLRSVSSMKQALNPRRASDTMEASPRKSLSAAPLTIPKQVLQRIESLGPVSIAASLVHHVMAGLLERQ